MINGMMNGDIRRHVRQTCAQKVTVMWCDAYGNDKCTSAPAMDISELGLRLLLPEPLPVLSFVTLRAEKIGLHGQASVRHCSRQGTRYSIGVEVARGIRLPRPEAQTT